ncbi:FHA domain-containing protein [Lysobacter sp. D1-1-M9]|uniref:FHA domain-containing protein n=1 Tax=Novilysobacter longmucuonensis TaxID=3098603 RepID=UPI002FCA5A54
MKLVFPGGEHPQVLLGLGVNRVGSDPQATIVLDRPGVMPQHCQLHVTAQGVMLDVPQGTSIKVNGRPVDGLITLRPGDSVDLDGVEARLAGIGAVAPVPLPPATGPGAASPVPANDDTDLIATAVRPVLPRFILRGVSGTVFGRTFPVHGAVTIGRAPECSVCLDEQGLSRLHARLMPTEHGLQLEDMGSSNGSYINGRRVLRGEAKAGDELGFDTLRFRLIGATQRVEDAHVAPASATAPRSATRWLSVALLLTGVALAGIGVYLGQA